MNYQFFNVLPVEAKMIREQVFIKEQGFQMNLMILMQEVGI